MTRPKPTTGAFALMAVLGAVTTLIGRQALAAEPTTAECLTAHEDSVTLIRNRQLRATRAKLAICSSWSCPAEIRAECLRRVPEIDLSMPTVVFEARDTAGTNLVAVTVKVDGEILAQRLQGSALAIDPGEHTFTFEVAGRPSVEKHLLILEGEKLRRERVEFEAIAVPKPAPPPPPVTPAKVELLESHPQPNPVSEHRLGKARIVALGLGGVGVVATGVGVAYGVIAMSRKNDANNVCPEEQCNDQPGVNAWNRAHSAGNISTGAFIIGAAGIASGIAVWFLAKPAADGDRSTQISLGPGGLRLEGRW
jgi:hypothetical protein